MSITEAPAQLQEWIDELGDQIAVLSTRRYKLIDAMNSLGVLLPGGQGDGNGHKVTVTMATAVTPEPPPTAALEARRASDAKRKKAERERAKTNTPPTRPANLPGKSKYDYAAIATAVTAALTAGMPGREAVQAMYPDVSDAMAGWVISKARKEGFDIPKAHGGGGRPVKPAKPEATVTSISAAKSVAVKPKRDWVEIAAHIHRLRDEGVSVQEALGKLYHVPSSTAKQWMKHCRESGLVKPLNAELKVIEDNTGTTNGDAVYDAGQVAGFYLDAIRSNQRPIQFVADSFGVDKGTAMEWVRRARADGALPATSIEPQLPEEERRAMLVAAKPESV